MITGFNEPIGTRRKIKDLPLCGYYSTHWAHYFNSIYYKHNKEFYKLGLANESQIIAGSAYIRAFQKREWSARNFAKFLEENIINTKNRSTKFTIKSFKLDSKFIDIYMDKFDEKIKNQRKTDIFERLIYLRNYPLTKKQEDLFIIFEENEQYPLKLFFNYGLVSYQRYIQLKKKCSLYEAIQKTRIDLKEIVKDLSGESDLRKKIISGIFRTTILWEPYTNFKQREHAPENSYIIDWREDYKKLIEIYGFRKERWWKEKHITFQLPQINSIKIFFSGKSRR